MDGRPDGRPQLFHVTVSFKVGNGARHASSSLLPTPDREEHARGLLYIPLHNLPFHIRVSAPVRPPVRLCPIFFLFCFVPFSFFSSPSSSFPPSSFIARSALTFCGNSSDSKSVPAARNGFSLLASAFFPFFFPFLGVDMTGKEKEKR